MKEKYICSMMGNITQAHAARLYRTGMKLIYEKDESIIKRGIPF